MPDHRSPDKKPDARPTPPDIPPEMPRPAPPRRAAPSVYTPDPITYRQPPPGDTDGFYLPLWSVGLMLMAVAGIVGCFTLLVVSLGGRQTPPTSAPRFVIITAQPTLLGQETLPALLVSPTLPEGFGPGFQGTIPAFALQGPTLAPVIFTPTPIALAVGAQVIVTDAGDSGLNIRSGPSRDNAVQFLAPEGTLFNIIAGPQQSADGLVWWQVQDPVQSSRVGWAASIYLTVVPPG
ncbi:MAG: SH3 domain-containing protein [Chloroflexi bacterium]|nr:SH3 domain-containing protein [Chloroflexota bacterium]